MDFDPTIIPGVPDSELNDHPGVGASPIEDWLWRDEWAQKRESASGPTAVPPQRPKIKPIEATTGNTLRPQTFEQIIGQPEAKALLSEMVHNAQARHRPLGHTLLVGPSGTGKSTFAFVIARAMGTNCYQLEAPISHDTLVDLQRIMRDGDILFLDEIHQQAIGERRGKSAATQPEVLFAVMEDRRLPTATGVLEFPAITVIGATTDEGMLPDAFIGRFPIRPSFEPYSEDDLTEIAEHAADALDVPIAYGAALGFARASRGVPREVTSYVRNAAELTDGIVDEAVAVRVLRDLLGVTPDGLTRDMQAMLRFLYERCMRSDARGDIVYEASVNTIATAIGKSRDSKAIALRVEPYLIQRGYIQVGHGGRRLTPEGVLRAIQLTARRES